MTDVETERDLMHERITYSEIIDEFRLVTGGFDPGSKRCCPRADDGIPECCMDLIEGRRPLLFSEREAALLGWTVEGGMLQQDGRDLSLNLRRWVRSDLITALSHGSLARTLQCASWPTLPSFREGDVIGVRVLSECNGPARLREYEQRLPHLLSLWQRAYALTGWKRSYAGTTGWWGGWILEPGRKTRPR